MKWIKISKKRDFTVRLEAALDIYIDLEYDLNTSDVKNTYILNSKPVDEKIEDITNYVLSLANEKLRFVFKDSSDVAIHDKETITRDKIIQYEKFVEEIRDFIYETIAEQLIRQNVDKDRLKEEAKRYGITTDDEYEILLTYF